ncbi:MAG: hypothetical protein LV480_02155 [Methylacidiphilales bacterium]|nr:hypothetical protein [Candidatus Methylacidiphilales bacterium]
MNKNALLIAGGVAFLVIWFIGWLAVAAWLWERNVTIADTATYSVKFGIIGTDSSGQPFISQETTTIPLRYKDSGFRYGLVITSSTNGTFSYQCIFHFSAPPKITSGGFDSSIPSQVMKTPMAQASGTALDYYWFDPGDPDGDQSLDVIVNGKLIQTIHYTVVPSS